MNKPKKNISIDLGMAVYCLMLALLFVAGVHYNQNKEENKRRLHIRSLAEAQAIDYQQGIRELKALKLESKSKYYFKLVKDYINK